MRRPRIAFQFISLFVIIFVVGVHCHCQVPCGIYDDELRIRLMLEDLTTIEKAIDEIISLTNKIETETENKAYYLHQITRWVNTKEHHAESIIDIIANYFLLQRIPEENTAEILNAVRIMKLALKLKQTLDKQFSVQLKTTLNLFSMKYLPQPPDVLTLSSLQSQQLVIP